MRSLLFVMCASICSSIFVLCFVATAAQADVDKVIWNRIVGIIEPGGIVGGVVDGTPAPWTVTNGSAEVDLDSGEVKFTVRGLVIADDPSFANLGTRSVVRKVKGTLVCNDTAPGDAELVDTEAVRLNARGNAEFQGLVDLPASCTDEPGDIVFLIRIADVSGPIGTFLIDLWNAFGAVRILKSN